MRKAAKLAIVLLATGPFLQGCQTLGLSGGDPPRRFATQANANCARLQPLVTASDGSLSRTQMEDALKAKYAKADADKSGDLSAAEVAPINDELRRQNVGASPVMDFNGDGRVNYQEFGSGWKTMFDLCGGGDEVVTQADMTHSPSIGKPRP